jgi:L-glyceraldehyde 3-phosphate reductase
MMGKVYSDRYWQPGDFEAVVQFKEITRKHGRSMAQFALTWILNNKAITSVLCGATSIKQLEENIGAVELTLTEEELNACDEVWHQLRPPRFFYGAQQLYR